MRKKSTYLPLFLLLALACSLPATATPPATEAPTNPIIIASSTPASIPAPATEPPGATGTFTLSVLVDVTSEPATREQAQTLVNEASQILIDIA